MTLLSTKETAARLGLSVARIRQLVRAGRLTPQKIGGHLLFDPREVAAFVSRPAGYPAGRPRIKKVTSDE